MDTSKIFEVLNAACYSLDTNERQSAMKALQNLESSEGSTFALINIIESENFPPDKADCKLMSIITLKNITNRCWNSRASTTRSLAMEEKMYVKGFLLNVAVGRSKLALDAMQDRKILSQLTLLAAKVARSDWPADWPELMPTLVKSINNASQHPTCLLVTMSFLESVLTELSTKTIPAAKKSFTDAAVQLFPILAHIWTGITTSVQSQLLCENPSVPAMFFQGDSLMTVTKALHVITVKAFPFLAGSSQFAEFLGIIVNHIRVSKEITMKYISAGAGLDGNGNPDSNRSLITVFSDVRSSEFESSESVARLVRGKYTSIFGSSMTADAEVARFAVVVMLDSSAAKLAGLLTVLQKDHPLGIVPYLEGLLDFAYNQIDARSRIGDVSANGVNIQAEADASCISFALFLSNTLSCSAYEPGESVAKRKQKLEFRISGGSMSQSQAGEADDGAEAASELARKIRGSFFSEERITNLLQLLLERCLSYSRSELLEWQEDPEQFYVAQEGLREDDTLKTACEGLYLGLLDASPNLVAGIITKFLNDVPRQLACITNSSGSGSGTISNEAMFWSNVYLCAGLSPAKLGEYLDIPVWVSSAAATIVNHLLQTPSAGAGSDDESPQLLRAKSLWLLGMFAYRLEPVVLVQIVNMLLSVLESQTVDVVVVLGAVASLGQVFAVDGFDASAHLDPHTVMRLVGALCSLTSQRLEEEESRERAIALVGEILRLSERLITGTGDGTNVQLLQALVAHFSCLWESSKPTSPLRVTITDTMTLLASLAGPQSPVLHDAALPLIAYATSGSQESSFLVKEAVLLWLAVLRNLPVITNDQPGSDMSIYFTPQLDHLMQSSLVNIFECGLVGDDVDDLKTVMMVVEAHAIASGPNFIAQCANQLHVMFERTIGQVAPRAVQYVTRPAEVLLLKYPQETASFLLKSGHIVTMLLPCCAAAAKTIPDQQLFEALRSHEEAEVAVIYYLSVFARVLLCCPQAVREIVNALLLRPELRGTNIQGFSGSAGASAGAGGDQGMILLRMLLRLMLDTFDSVSLSSGGSWRRRLWSLALISLYPSNTGSNSNSNSNRDSDRNDITDSIESVSFALSDVVPMDWFPEVVNIVDDVLCEEEREKEHSSSLEHDEEHCIASDDDDDGAYCEDDDDDGNNGRWGVVKLYNEMLRRDIVNRAPLQRVLKEKMHAIISRIGEAAFNQGMLSSLGPTIMERISARSL